MKHLKLFVIFVLILSVCTVFCACDSGVTSVPNGASDDSAIDFDEILGGADLGDTSGDVVDKYSSDTTTGSGSSSAPSGTSSKPSGTSSSAGGTSSEVSSATSAESSTSQGTSSNAPSSSQATSSTNLNVSSDTNDKYGDIL